LGVILWRRVMKRFGLLAVLLVVCLGFVATPPPAAAQADFRAQIRGVVKTSRARRFRTSPSSSCTPARTGSVSSFKVTTNKKGGFVRIGLMPGPTS